MSTTWMLLSSKSLRTITSTTSNLTLWREWLCGAIVMDLFVNNIVDASISNSDNPITLYEPVPNDQN